MKPAAPATAGQPSSAGLRSSCPWDVRTPRHHGFVAEGRYETAGQVYLGVEPEFGFVAF